MFRCLAVTAAEKDGPGGDLDLERADDIDLILLRRCCLRFTLVPEADDCEAESEPMIRKQKQKLSLIFLLLFMLLSCVMVSCFCQMIRLEN